MREYLKGSFRKLDNMAKIFSLDDKRNTNVFRYSIILKQNVDQYVLESALKKTLNTYSAFRVKISAGLFWNYFKYNSKEPVVKEEKEFPCKYIDFKKNNDYLFRVTYCGTKINLDVLHVLTDGNGALHFFKSIVYNYLDLKNGVLSGRSINNNITCYDQYLKNYDKDLNEKMEFKGAYLFPKKIIKNINNTYHYVINIDLIKKVCKNYNVTITEYLTALYIYAIYLSIYNKKSGKEIVVTVPIDIRKYYKVDTLSNFFVCMNINPRIVEKNLTTFEQILKEVKKDFKKKLNEDKIKQYLARDVKLGMNIFIGLVPLFIKKIFMKYVGGMFIKSSTSTLSNVGIVDIDDKYKKYIDNILVLVIPGRIQKIKCTICSFDKNLNVTINSNIDDKEFESVFYKLLKEQIGYVDVESNCLDDFIEF